MAVNDRSAWKEMLGYWMSLARIRDEVGLPTDLIYYVARERNALPYLTVNGQLRPVTEDEFEQGIRDCVAIRQGRSPQGMNLTSSQINTIRAEF